MKRRCRWRGEADQGRDFFSGEDDGIANTCRKEKNNLPPIFGQQVEDNVC